MKKYRKHKELELEKFLQENFPIPFFYRDSIVDYVCSKQRPDFVYHFGTHVLVIECDENQHASYASCGKSFEERMTTERRRMFNIFQMFDGLPVTFLRYNPDAYDKKRQKSQSERQQILLNYVKKIQAIPPMSGLSVKFLFYDGYDNSDLSFQSISEADVL